MIQHDTGWKYWKPYGYYSCYEECERTVTFTPDTSDEEIAHFIAEERKKWPQSFSAQQKPDNRSIVYLKAAVDSSD